MSNGIIGVDMTNGTIGRLVVVAIMIYTWCAIDEVIYYWQRTNVWRDDCNAKIVFRFVCCNQYVSFIQHTHTHNVLTSVRRNDDCNFITEIQT
jgi:hypothetical protein